MELQEGKYLVRMAETPQEKKQVYQLRHHVYHHELHLACPSDGSDQEYDSYDELCDHLMICDAKADRCVSTFRFLSGKKLGGKYGFYSEQWFDIGKLSDARSRVLELGRACIDPQYRNTKVFKLLFCGVGAYLKRYPHDYLIGLTTVACDSRQHIEWIADYLKNKNVINLSLGIRPIKQFEFDSMDTDGTILAPMSEREILSKMSTLMLAYHKYGAEFIFEPSMDVDFDPPVVDFFTIFSAEKYPKWVS